MSHRYLIAIGSNRASRHHASPRRAVIETAIALGCAAPPLFQSRALGPGGRNYCNSVILVHSPLSPDAMLAMLKRMEAHAGRRAGRRWGARPLDLDIIGWSGGIWATPTLQIPHPSFRERRFVLAPLVRIAPAWRDPVTGLTVRQLLSRLDRRRARS